MIEVEIKGVALSLETAAGLFSPRQADRGTLAMLSQADLAPGAKVLDLGCGCGLVGLLAAKLCGEENVVMCDIDPLAVDVARKNALRNGVGGVKIVLSDGFRALDDAGFRADFMPYEIKTFRIGKDGRATEVNFLEGVVIHDVFPD